MAPRWVGPFLVEQLIGKVACKLRLPGNMRIHPVFHVSKLKSFVRGREEPEPVPIIIDNQEEMEVERILEHRLQGIGGRKHKHVHDEKQANRVKRQKLYYETKWKGQGVEHITWEPAGIGEPHAKECVERVLEVHENATTSPT